jgi:methylamine dehydrogenase accessory protein MauD
MDPLAVSHVALWIVVLALGVAVLALARQVGVLHERVAPMGALMMDSGPKIGEQAPSFTLKALGSETVVVGAEAARRTGLLLFFMSPTCPVCKKLLPALKSLRESERGRHEIVLASDGDMTEHLAYREAQGLQDFPYVLSTELGVTFRIGKLPYAVLLDAQGTVRAKGLVNSREQLESLLVADEMGVASIQDYLRKAS